MKIKVGQKWRDNDRRVTSPDFTVVRLSNLGDFAFVKRWDGREYRISTQRLAHGRAYMLLEDVPAVKNISSPSVNVNHVSGDIAMSDWVPIDGQWHFITFTQANGLFMRYVDGVAIDPAPTEVEAPHG